MKTLTPKEEMQLIHQVALRAQKMLHYQRELMLIEMDITYCNEDIPLDLQKFLDAPDFDFMHDVVGIANHINHDTLKMEHCFLPRCAIPSDKPVYVPRRLRVDSMMAEFASK
jgi:hypothetical protein